MHAHLSKFFGFKTAYVHRKKMQNALPFAIFLINLVRKGYPHEILNCFIFLQHAFLIVSTLKYPFCLFCIV